MTANYTATALSAMRSGKPVRFVHCQCCDRVTTLEDAMENWHKLYLRDRGCGSAYACDHHGHNRDDLAIRSYSAENNLRYGKSRGGDNTYSYEWECHEVTLLAKVEMSHACLMASRDCTTDIEYKSPIYMNMSPLVANVKKTMARLVEDELLQLTEADGTHFNVGTKSDRCANFTEWCYYHTYEYIDLFARLTAVMQAFPEATEAIFGRNFNRWARPIGGATLHAGAHENWINIQHETHIEFRLCKFRNADQYHIAMWLCRKIKETCMSNIEAHLIDGELRDKRKIKNASAQFVRYFHQAMEQAQEKGLL